MGLDGLCFCAAFLCHKSYLTGVLELLVRKEEVLMVQLGSAKQPTFSLITPQVSDWKLYDFELDLQ